MDGEGQEQGLLMITLPTLPLAHELALPAVCEAYYACLTKYLLKMYIVHFHCVYWKWWFLY